jgi:hypothetical protein
MKNRKRESCTSGTVRDEDGNILIYSAQRRKKRREGLDRARRRSDHDRFDWDRRHAARLW